MPSAPNKAQRGDQILNAKKKVSDMEKARKKLKVSGDSTSDVQRSVVQLAKAFEDYVKSDNLSATSLIRETLLVEIEEHEDFQSAVRYLDQAIQKAKEEVQQEEEAGQQKQYKFGGVM